jgi:hypothetical protein
MTKTHYFFFFFWLNGLYFWSSGAIIGILWNEEWSPICLKFAMDYRCEDDRFPVSASCETNSNPSSLSSRETVVGPGMRSWKKHLSEWDQRQKAFGGTYFPNKWRGETSQPGSKLTISNPGLKAVSSSASPGWSVRFLRAMIVGFWKGESKTI